MKLNFTLAAIAVLVLFTNGSSIALAQSGDSGKTEAIKSNVQKRLRNGKTDVKVEKFDGTKIKGKITQADDNGFTFVESKTNNSNVVAYSDTKRINAGGWPLGAKIAIGVGAAAIITFVAFGLAYRRAAGNN